MLSLVKIRIRFIIRKPCLLLWTYMVIPGIIIFAGINTILNKTKQNLETYDKDALEDSTRDFLGNKFQNLLNLEYLNLTGFVVDKEENCKKIEKVFNDNKIPIPNDYPEYLFCTTLESNLTNLTVNVIKIIKENGRYKVSLKCKGGDSNRYEEIYSHKTFRKLNDFVLYKSDDLDQNLIIDPFYVYRKNSSDKFLKMDLFFELQSLVSKILIELEGKTNIQKSFKMSFGYNKYPDSYRFVDSSQILSVNLVSFLVTLQFALIALIY